MAVRTYGVAHDAAGALAMVMSTDRAEPTCTVTLTGHGFSARAALTLYGTYELRDAIDAAIMDMEGRACRDDAQTETGA